MSTEEYFSSKTTGASGTLGYDVKDLSGKMETGFHIGDLNAIQFKPPWSDIHDFFFCMTLTDSRF